MGRGNELQFLTLRKYLIEIFFKPINTFLERPTGGSLGISGLPWDNSGGDSSLASGPCQYNCKSDGSCEVSRTPGFKGYCSARRFGGTCRGTPPGCTICINKCERRNGSKFDDNN